MKFGAFPLGEWVRLSTTTLAMSLLAVAGAAFLGLVLSFPTASNFQLPGRLLDAGGAGKLRQWLGTALLVVTRGFLLAAARSRLPFGR